MVDHLDYLDLSDLSWKRPPGPLKVWNVVEGRKKTEDGKTLKFSIQDIPEHRYEEAIDFMCKYFLTEEPISVSSRVTDDPVAVKEISTLWRSVLRQGIAVAALMDNPNGGEPLIAGVNVLGVVTPQDEDQFDKLEFKTTSMRKVIGTIMSLSHEADVFTKYGVDSYITALGLSALPTLRGQGIGFHILKARESIGREFHIPVTETAFTATASQILADRAGYEVLAEKKYSDMVDEEGKLVFPGVPVHSLKVMGRRLY